MGKVFEKLSKSIIQSVEEKFQPKELLSYLKVNVGDLIEIGYKIPEGEKERIQNYQGMIIAKKNKTAKKSITLRRKVDGIGVEQVFFLNSPKISSLKKIESSKVRRSKLYFLRKINQKLSKKENVEKGPL